MAFDFPDLFRAIAVHASTAIPTLRQVSYPAPGRINATPALIVLSGSDTTAGWDVVHEGSGEQLWTGMAALQLLVARSKDIEREALTTDEYVFPIIDAFSIDRDGIGVELPSLAQHVDRCLIVHHNTNLSMQYGNQKYVGIEFHLDIKFHRVWDQ